MSMGFSFEQNQRLEQKQIMSHQMIQSLDLLQLPIQKLEEQIEQELEKNPALERIDESVPESENTDDDAAPIYERESEIEIRDGDERDDFATADEFAENYHDTIDERPVRSQNWLDAAQERHHDQMANIASRGETLQDHLLAQLVWCDLPENIAALCKTIICNLDAGGRLTAPDEGNKDPLAYFVLGPNPTQEDRDNAEKALEIVRHLEPRGVGAFDVTQTLLLQLDGNDETTLAARTLLTDYRADLEDNRIGGIAKKTGWPIEKIESALLRIRSLNPRPTAQFQTQTTAAVLPEVFVEKNDEGKWTARIEENPLFNLKVSPEYKAFSEQKGNDRSTKNFFRRNIGSAQWLIDAVAQRRATLLAVSQAIVDHQIEFFEHGPEKLRPLKMQQIADSVGVHNTTVSRACDDKWMQSPRGIIPLRWFFSGSIAIDGDKESVAKESVKERLRTLINEEDKTHPLSDEDLVKKLKSHGFQIERRTVAKYRNAMRIPSSHGRREWK